jgi:hypothetical protein
MESIISQMVYPVEMRKYRADGKDESRISQLEERNVDKVFLT